MSKPYPEATRQFEYVAFVVIPKPTKEGEAYVFMAVDGYSHFVFLLGVEPARTPMNVLKHIRSLMRHKDFKTFLDEGWPFTLVLNDFSDLSESIEHLIKPYKGDVLDDRGFNNRLAGEVIKSFKAIFRL